MHIKSFMLKDVKVIANLEVTFDQPAGWHVIIGDNSAGKSTLAKALVLGLIGADNFLSMTDFGGWIRFGQEEANLSYDFELHKEYEAFEQDKLSKQYSLSPIYETYVAVRSKSEKWEPEYKTNLKGYFSSSFGPYRRLEGSSIFNSLYTSKPRLAAHRSTFEGDFVFSRGIDWLKKLKFASLSNDYAAGFLLDFFIKFINRAGLLPNGFVIIDVNSEDILIKGFEGHISRLNEQSDGIKSVLSLVLEILYNLILNFTVNEIIQDDQEYKIKVPGVVIIDEVDVHLHPEWQTKIGDWFTTQFPNMQFIVTTHSALICRGCGEMGTIIKLATPNSSYESGVIVGAERSRLVFGNMLDAYGTELFGKQPNRSLGVNKKNKLAILEAKFAFAKLSPEEDIEYQILKQTFSTDDTH